MSCDLEVANDSARFWEKISCYITVIVTFIDDSHNHVNKHTNLRPGVKKYNDLNSSNHWCEMREKSPPHNTNCLRADVSYFLCCRPFMKSYCLLMHVSGRLACGSLARVFYISIQKLNNCIMSEHFSLAVGLRFPTPTCEFSLPRFMPRL